MMLPYVFFFFAMIGLAGALFFFLEICHHKFIVPNDKAIVDEHFPNFMKSIFIYIMCIIFFQELLK